MLVGIIEKALAKDPDDRFQTAAGMADVLRIVDLTAAPSAPRTTPQPPAHSAAMTAPLPNTPKDMILIPAGPFLMGSETGCRHESPEHTVELPAYYIGRYPVTVGEFMLFWEVGGYEDPHCWTEHGWEWRQRHNVTAPRYLHKEPWSADPRLPVAGVSWHDVYAYITWLGEQTGQPFRLPTEAEWEKAGRGTDGRTYPWGNDYEVGRANVNDGYAPEHISYAGHTSIVGSCPDGASPYGVMDLSGNVWEWTNSTGQPFPYDPSLPDDPLVENRAILRGGSWLNDSSYARLTFRQALDCGSRGSEFGFGFRLARDA